MIGVASSFVHRPAGLEYLKLESLFVDKLIFLEQPNFILFQGTIDPTDEIDALVDCGFAVRHSFNQLIAAWLDSKFGGRDLVYDNFKHLPDEEKYQAIVLALDGKQIRQYAQHHFEQTGLDTVAMSGLGSPLPFPATGLGEALQVTLNTMPTPTRELPWDDFLQLKSEPEFQHRLRLFRHWLRNVAKSQLSASEIEDEAKTALYEYELYLKSIRVKYELNAFEWVITSGGTLVEDLLNLRIGKLSKAPFSLSKKIANYRISEQGAPGRSLSVLALARDKLGI